MFTIFSSFFFLFPIMMCHLHQDTSGVLAFGTGMGLSIANHSHRVHPIKFQRQLFNRLDRLFFYSFVPYLLVQAYLHHLRFVYVLSIFLLNSFFWFLIGKKSPSSYGRFEKIAHSIFHLVGISSMTFLRVWTKI